MGSVVGNKNHSLKTLFLGQCSSLRDDHVRDIGRRHELSFTELLLYQCLRVKKPELRFERLERLSLMGCFALTDLPNFYCPTIRFLDLSFSFRLSDVVIQAVLQSLPQLEEMQLTKCPNLESLALESYCIRAINVDYCNNLKTLKLRCPSLERLHNVGCSNLYTVLIDEAETLESLNFSMLPITRLEVFACNLRRLNLSGCRRLDHCNIHCPSLEKVNVRGSRTVALRFCKEVREVVMSNWTRIPLQVQ